MKIQKVLLTILVFATFAALQSSNAQAIQEIEVITLDRPYIKCLDEGGSGSIIVHWVSLYDKGGLKALHSNIIDGWFVGAVSGTEYKVIETRKYSQQIHENNLQQTNKYQIAFKLISPKNGKSFSGHANLHFTINALGILIVERLEWDLCFPQPWPPPIED